MSFTGTLFVEGEADLKFLMDFVKKRFNYDLEKGREIQKIEGKDNLSNYSLQFQIGSDLGLTNLLIVDANGAFEKRRNELTKLSEALNLNFQLFLVPNNSDNGDLETLLMRIANFKNLFDCIESYKNCIESLKIKELRGIDAKAKMFIYIDSFQNAGSPKENDRNYLSSIWNLESPDLDPLYDFLKGYFIED